jgi:hypothetical protein
VGQVQVAQELLAKVTAEGQQYFDRTQGGQAVAVVVLAV